MANNNFITAAETPNFMIWISGVDGSNLLGEGASTIYGNVVIDVSEPIVESATSAPDGTVDLTEHAILYSWSFALKKVISPNSGSDLYASSRIQGTPLQVIIANGHYVATLENAFITGQTLAVISIVKLANLPTNSNTDAEEDQSPVVTEQNVFEGCYLLSLEPKYDSKTNMDTVKMEIRYSKRTHTIFKYSQQGDLRGQNQSVYDFTKNQIDSNLGTFDKSGATEATSGGGE
jgi:hypothetical protein